MAPVDEPAALLDRMLGGDRRALARLLSLAESEPARFDPIADRVAAAALARAGKTLRVGITGPGGAGKSSLIDAWIKVARARQETVAVLATDPSSERSGGALLGDRVRLAQDAPDDGVYFRSVATRGAAGGLAHTGFDQADLLDAFGFDWLLVEAVGAGQGEIEVSFACDVTVVVFAPGGGDAVQAMKAGLMEVADIFVVNKADRDGAHALMADIRFSVHLQYTSGSPVDVDWETPVLAAQAVNDVGVAELLEAVVRHRAALGEAGALDARRRDRRRADLGALLVEELTMQVMARAHADPELERTLALVSDGALDPYSAVTRILSSTLARPVVPQK
jgi:LAO/AO transport system kinase